LVNEQESANNNIIDSLLLLVIYCQDILRLLSKKYLKSFALMKLHDMIPMLLNVMSFSVFCESYPRFKLECFPNEDVVIFVGRGV